MRAVSASFITDKGEKIDVYINHLGWYVYNGEKYALAELINKFLSEGKKIKDVQYTYE